MKKGIVVFFLLVVGSVVFAQKWEFPNLTTKYGVNNVFKTDSFLYLCSSFASVNGDSSLAYAVKWDGDSLYGLKTDTFYGRFDPRGYDIEAIAEYKGKVIVKGQFSGESMLNNIAQFDGKKWERIGGVDRCFSMIVYKDELYIGGTFTDFDGKQGAGCIMRWDGNRWDNLKGGVTGDFYKITSMAVYHDELYVVGTFDLASDVETFNIAKWDGENWHSVGMNFYSPLNTIFADTVHDKLYVGGDIQNQLMDDSLLAWMVAQYDGKRWTTMGKPFFPSNVYAYGIYHGKVYGASTGNGQDSLDRRLGIWDGEKWNQELPNFNGLVYQFHEFKGSLYAFGDFTHKGQDSTLRYIARYTEPEPPIGITIKKKKEKTLELFPNPTNDKLTIQFPENISEKRRLQIFDVLGNKVKEIELSSGEKTYELNISTLAKGSYECRILLHGKTEYQNKFIKQ